ncbi:MAG: hypothetical protein ACYCXQ_12160 [Candidatus Humimicrobiaceae bacterium]
MSIFYDTLERFKDFSSMVNIKIQQYLPEFSLFENIINSYDKTLDDNQKIENKNYIEIKNKLELLNQDIKTRQDVIKNLTPLLLDFENSYNKKYSELELQVISQKSFIRVKEDELKNYIASYELKIKEKKQLEGKKAILKSDIEKLKSDIEERCQKYIETVNMKNIDEFKSSVIGVSAGFSENIQENNEIISDYISSEEYLNSTMEYKGVYKRLYAFMSGLFDITQHFIDESNFEKMLPDLVEIQKQIKEKYNNMDQIDVQINKIKDFETLKKNYNESLKNAENELENIIGLADKDEELLKIKAEIQEYINKNQII